MNHWISLYLAGQYPQYYKLPNRFDVLFKIRQIDANNFSDTLISLLKDKQDLEFYSTLLDTFQSLHSKEDYSSLLDRLDVPVEVRSAPYNLVSKSQVDLQKIERFLEKANETQFSRFIVMPILQAMGYENVEYKGKVTESDFGMDLYPVAFKSPAGLKYFTGVQLKSCKMSNGSSSPLGAETKKLIQEIEAAFLSQHMDNSGEELYISEILVFNSKHVNETVRNQVLNSNALKGKRVRFWAKDGVLSLIAELDFKKDFFEHLDL